MTTRTPQQIAHKMQEYFNTIENLLQTIRNTECSVCGAKMYGTYEPGVGVLADCLNGCKTDKRLYVDFREVMSGRERKRNYDISGGHR